MKKTILKITGGIALALLLATIFTQIWVSARETNKEQRNEFSVSYPGGTLEGFWQAQATFTNCQTGAALSPAFASVSTYMFGGTMSEFGVASGLFRSQGQGTWRHDGRLNYSAAFTFFRFNPDGTYLDRVVVRRQIEFRPDNLYNATSRIEFYDPSGNLVRRGCTSETATRFE